MAGNSEQRLPYHDHAAGLHDRRTLLSSVLRDRPSTDLAHPGFGRANAWMRPVLSTGGWATFTTLGFNGRQAREHVPKAEAAEEAFAENVAET